MKKRLQYQTKSFGVTYRLDSYDFENKTIPLFRISHNSVSSVKRNKIKRVVREFIRNHPGQYTSKIVVHIQKKHVHSALAWMDYLKGLQNDLERFSKQLQYDSQKFYNYSALVH